MRAGRGGASLKGELDGGLSEQYDCQRDLKDEVPDQQPRLDGRGGDIVCRAGQ